MADGFRRQALIIPISHSLPSRDPGAIPYPYLPLSIPAARELENSLRSFGYTCRVEADLSSDELGTAVNDAIRAGRPNELLIVAILSNSDTSPVSQDLYVLGSDGRRSSTASVTSWIDSVEESPDRPAVHVAHARPH